MHSSSSLLAAGQLPGQTAVACRHTQPCRLRHSSLLPPTPQRWPAQLACSRLWPQNSSRSSSRRSVAAHAAATEAVNTDPGDWLDINHRSRNRYVNHLNQEHAIEDFVEFYQGTGGLPSAYIMHPNGHTLEINLQGATITRWLLPDGTDLLYTRSDAVFEPGEAINSGIPLVFPQWREGPLPFNGFADKLQWEVVGADLDFEFVNSLVSKDDFANGEAELLVDDDGYATVPKPHGILDADDFEEDDPDALDDLDQGLDDMFAEDEGEEPAPKPKTRKRTTAAEEETPAAAAETNTVVPGAASSSSSEEDEQDAELQNTAADDEEAEEDEEEDDVEFGVIEDPAPYIILKLSDTEETRAVWPHKFELYYKITLMETDEFPDPKSGFPTGIHEWTGSDRPMRPEHEAFLEALDTGDEEQIESAAAAAALAEARELRGDDDGAGGQSSRDGYRMFTDDDGVPDDDDDEELLEAVLGKAEPEKPAKPSGRGRRKKVQEPSAEDAGAALGDAADGDVATVAADDDDAQDLNDDYDDDDEEEDDDDDIPRGVYDPPEEPMQIKMEWVLVNKDDVGSPPMRFQLGALPHLRTQDQMRFGHFVRILGLGGSMTFDYSDDPRRPRLVGCQDDYVNFEGQRRDTVYIGSHEADVMFCPGNRTHFELVCREGVQDRVVYHPGAVGLPTLSQEDERFFAQIGAGKLAHPKKLAPGESWKGCYVVRYHPRYWDPPVWDRNGPQPMPLLQTKQDEADDPDGLEDVEDNVEGIDQSSLGGGPAVPYMDE